MSEWVGCDFRDFDGSAGCFKDGRGVLVAGKDVDMRICECVNVRMS